MHGETSLKHPKPRTASNYAAFGYQIDQTMSATRFTPYTIITESTSPWLDSPLVISRALSRSGWHRDKGRELGESSRLANWRSRRGVISTRGTAAPDHAAFCAIPQTPSALDIHGSRVIRIFETISPHVIRNLYSYDSLTVLHIRPSTSASTTAYYNPPMDSPDTGSPHSQQKPSSALSSVPVGRIRTIEGSCWSCKKRRVKCDLAKPQCERCSQVGATCDYTARPIRWCTRPTTTAPARYQVAPTVDDYPAASLVDHERRALSYFRGRFWPLLTTTFEPCTPPMMLALEHRVLLLAICLVADTHRILQDGRNSRRVPQLKRLECISAVRDEVNEFCSSGKPPLTGLLFAVLLLYFHDGYLECAEESASTASHHAGANAIMQRLGGIETVLDTGPEALHMLVSEFASTDLTTAILNGRRPSFSPKTWGKIDQRCVWWSRDPSNRFSLAIVLGQISSMVHFWEDVSCGLAELSPDRIRDFEVTLTPTYAPFSTLTSSIYGPYDDDSMKENSEVVDAYALTRSFQHAALIYLYRAICGLSMDHSIVRQHVLPCLDCILNIEGPSKAVNCALFPLLVAGAHVQSARHQRGVMNVLKSVHSNMKFTSVQSVRTVLDGIWRSESRDIPWFEMFAGLGADAAVL